jgi:hypothetical protein
MTELGIANEAARNAVHPSLDRIDFMSCYSFLIKIGARQLGLAADWISRVLSMTRQSTNKSFVTIP